MTTRRERLAPCSRDLRRTAAAGACLVALRLAVDPASRSSAALATTLVAVGLGVALAVALRACGRRLLMTGQESTTGNLATGVVHSRARDGRVARRRPRRCRHDSSSR